MKAADDESPELKPFLDHLEDLRVMLIRSAIALVVGMTVVIPFLPRIVALLKRPLHGVVDHPDEFLQILDVVSPFTLAMHMAFWSGLVLSSPFVTYFIAQFIFPALKRAEQKAVKGAAGFAVGLFLLGVVLAYLFMLPFAVRAMISVGRWMGFSQEFFEVRKYMMFCLQVLGACGLAFEMPVVLAMLGRFGVIKTAHLRDKRRHAFVAILILAAILSPPDGLTMWIIAAPLYVMYEICIWLIWGWERQRAKEDAGRPA